MKESTLYNIISKSTSYRIKRITTYDSFISIKDYLNSFSFYFNIKEFNNNERPWFYQIYNNCYEYPIRFRIAIHQIYIKRCDMLLKYLFYSSDIIKFIDKNNDIYYCGEGMILNSKLKPILICTRVNGDVVVFKFDMNIFENKNKVVEKYLIKDLMPSIASRSCNYEEYGFKLKFEIENNLDKYILKPCAPEELSDIGNVEKFLIDNTDNYIQYLNYLVNINE